MTEFKFVSRECDRCGTKQDRPDTKSWLKINATTKEPDGHREPVIGGTFGTLMKDADLCPDCSKQFIEWWNSEEAE